MTAPNPRSVREGAAGDPHTLGRVEGYRQALTDIRAAAQDEERRLGALVTSTARDWLLDTTARLDRRPDLADRYEAWKHPEREAAIKHLARDAVSGHSFCSLTPEPGRRGRHTGGCTGLAVAVRFAGGFSDVVCRAHAEDSSRRGLEVVWP